MKDTAPRKAEVEQTEFKKVRIQRLPASVTLGYNPLYAMRQQLRQFAPGADYVKDGAAEDDGVFDHFLVPRAAHDAMQAGLAKIGNDRVTRPDATDITSRTGAGLAKPEDKVTVESQTLEQVGASLPSQGYES